jgi:hypothetical protein
MLVVAIDEGRAVRPLRRQQLEGERGLRGELKGGAFGRRDGLLICDVMQRTALWPFGGIGACQSIGTLVLWFVGICTPRHLDWPR